MSATKEKYRGPHVTQHGVDTTLNDCAACALVVNLAYATLGEFVTAADGREMGKAQLHALVRQGRRNIHDTEAGLDLTQVQDMAVEWGFPRPASVDIKFPQMKDQLRARAFTFWLAGNPTHIKNPSPRERCDCSHAWAVADIRGQDAKTELLLYDPLRNAGPRQRGEWVPDQEIRQMAFKDSDGALNLVIRFPIGGYRAEIRRLADLRKRFDRVQHELDVANTSLVSKDNTIRTLRNRLEACEARPDVPDDTALLIKAAVDQALDEEREEISRIVLAR